jgi:Ser/Thr protein kinase RdoA (MazF antagonist)
VWRVPDYEQIVSEFGLGRLVDTSPLAGGGAEVIKLTTSAGVFVVKPARAADGLELADEVAIALTKAGLAQGRLLRARDGGLVSQSGHSVAEFLAGQIYPTPTRVQTKSTMRYLAPYHQVLADVPVPPWLLTADTVWTRVASADYLTQQLPGLFDRFGPRAGGQRLVAAALGQVETSLPLIRGLPRQLVHGDVGPDNVLSDGDEVVAIIDFTPHYQPLLFAVATAVYWYHVHGHPELDAEGIWSSLETAQGSGRWTDIERAVWPSMLLMEALRRLATPLALAAETGAELPPDSTARSEAVAVLVQSWPRLSQSRR